MSFKVKTDEDFYNRFKKMELKIRKISLFFQNEDAEVSHYQWEEYLRMVTNFNEEFAELISEADNRFELQ